MLSLAEYLRDSARLSVATAVAANPHLEQGKVGKNISNLLAEYGIKDGRSGLPGISRQSNR
jgi:hypothetical protein